MIIKEIIYMKKYIYTGYLEVVFEKKISTLNIGKVCILTILGVSTFTSNAAILLMDGVSLTSSSMTMDFSDPSRGYIGFEGGSIAASAADQSISWDTSFDIMPVVSYIDSDVIVNNFGRINLVGSDPIYFGYHPNSNTNVEIGNNGIFSQPTGSSYFGYGDESKVTVNINNGGFINSKHIYIGYEGSSTFNINGTGVVKSDIIDIATKSNSNSTLNINTPDLSNIQISEISGGDGKSILNFNNEVDSDTNIKLSGGLSIVKSNKNILTLLNQGSYTGSTIISAGTLKTGVEDAFASTSGVTVTDGATLNLGGNSQHINAGTGTLTNSGTVLINDAGADVLAKVVTLYGDMINSGLVVINNGPTNAGQTLAVNGDWTGNGGTVSLGTVLGGDDSLTDKLAISGNASGTTYVSVANEGGTGAQTLEGIELISTGSSTADAFVQSGRVVAGSYEYHLQKGSASGANMNNWYLTSQNQNAQTYRPERGSYASNLQAAATMFSMRLKDRQGGSVYTDPVTGERHESSLWVRSVGGHTEGRLSDGQSKYSANRMVFQLGGDVLNGSLGADDAWHLGLMGGYGKQYSNTHNNLSGYNSKGSVWGYSTGIYGTWYQNAKDKTGLYADSWLAWNWFDNSVKGDELSYEKYKSKGLTASLETGYVFHTGSYVTSGGMENNVYVTPQAQVLWSGVKADNHTEANGTTVEGRGSDNIQTRLGVRLSMTGQSRLDKDSVRQFEPFVEANWVYTAKDYGVKMGDSSAYLQGSRNVAELKTGVEGRVSENLSVWGSVAQQLGGNSYQDTQGMLGVKYAF